MNNQGKDDKINKAFAKQLKTEGWRFDWDESKVDVYQLTLVNNRLMNGVPFKFTDEEKAQHQKEMSEIIRIEKMEKTQSA